VETDRIGEVSLALSNFNFQVFNTQLADRVGDPLHYAAKTDKESILICQMKLPVQEVNKAFSLQQTLRSIRGINSIDLAMYDWEEPPPTPPPTPPKLQWYERRFMPLLVSTAIACITILYAVYHIQSVLDPENTKHIPWYEFALIIGVPTAINFLFQYVHKYHPHDHVL
jgi:hypothetical protein